MTNERKYQTLRVWRDPLTGYVHPTQNSVRTDPAILITGPHLDRLPMLRETFWIDGDPEALECRHMMVSPDGAWAVTSDPLRCRPEHCHLERPDPDAELLTTLDEVFEENTGAARLELLRKLAAAVREHDGRER